MCLNIYVGDAKFDSDFICNQRPVFELKEQCIPYFVCLFHWLKRSKFRSLPADFHFAFAPIISFHHWINQIRIYKFEGQIERKWMTFSWNVQRSKETPECQQFVICDKNEKTKNRNLRSSTDKTVTTNLT